MLRARERAPTPCLSAIFSLDSHLSPLRSLGVRQKPTLFKIQNECEKEKKYEPKRVEVEENEVKAKNKTICSHLSNLHAFLILICPKFYKLFQKQYFGNFI